jgi:hypothetical protein
MGNRRTRKQDTVKRGLLTFIFAVRPKRAVTACRMQCGQDHQPLAPTVDASSSRRTFGASGNSRVAERYGRTPRTIERWLDDEKLNFPQPVYINRFKYWNLDELETWERKQAATSVRSSEGHPAPRNASRQLVEHQLSVLEDRRVEALGKPGVDWREEITGFSTLSGRAADRSPGMQQKVIAEPVLGGLHHIYSHAS